MKTKDEILDRITKLEEEMEDAAEDQNYTKASFLSTKISVLKWVIRED